jgi:hypothetical protein
VPGYHGDNQDPEFLFKKAQEIGEMCSKIKILSWLIYICSRFSRPYQSHSRGRRERHASCNDTYRGGFL